MRTPDFPHVRSAIVIVEMDDGTTMQSVLTPTWYQPVEMHMEVEYDHDPRLICAPAGDPTFTLTLTAGGYVGQVRASSHRAEQVSPAAIGGPS